MVEDLLVCGLDDWAVEMDATAFAHDRYKHLPDMHPRDLRTMVVGALSEVIIRGLMVPGSIEADIGFVPWGISPGEAIARIISRLDAVDDNHRLTPGSVVWFDLTETGARLANDALLLDR